MDRFSKEFIEEITLKLLNKIRGEKYSGYDPYDALNSPILNFLSFKSKYLKIVYTQAFKRLPINLRKIFFVKRGVNPKTLGLLLEGVSILSEIGILDGKDIAIEILEKLKELRSGEYSHFSWGYNFPWQSRVFYLKPLTPTIVNTSFIGNALFKAYEVFKVEEFKEIGIDSSLFVFEEINRSFEGDTVCFSYTPLDNTMIHNSNLLGASLLLNGNRFLKRKDIEDIIHKSFKYTLNHQNEDGSWFYAEKKMQNWIDNFHTGFVLDSILKYYEFYPFSEVKEKLLKGFKFYRENFFEDWRIPKYYHDRIYPIDIHSISQSLITLTKFQRFEDNSFLIKNVFNYMVDNFYSEKRGYFYYRKGKFFTNKIDYMRWSQGWSFKALSYLLRFLNEKG